MHVLIAMFMILGACVVVVVGLLSVINDLLIRTARHTPVQFHSDDIDGSDDVTQTRDGRAQRASIDCPASDYKHLTVESENAKSYFRKARGA
jgi:hypothetical protein